MKKFVFSIGLCLLVSGSMFAQKKNVSTAEKLVKGEKPEFAEAVTLIQAAMQNPETKNDPKTWYVAGFIENQQFDAEKMKQMLGQQPNEEVMYKALGEVLPYFMVCDSLDQLPNEKGKIKPKFVKDIKSILRANLNYYINGGAYYFDKQDYPTAYKFFDSYLEIPNLPMFKDEKEPLVSKTDSTYKMIQFYAGVAASQMQKPALAIEKYKALKDADYRGNEVYQCLSSEYIQSGDTANYIEVMKEGVAKFPEEKYFLLGLIQQLISSGKNQDAVTYLESAIQKDPQNAQLYDVMGRLYEESDPAKAQGYFEKALAIDPNYTDALGNLGRIYFNQAVKIQTEANAINDNKLYREELDKAKALYEKAMPYFEKAHAANPEAREYMVALRGIYYNLNMGDKYEAIEAKMNQ